MVKMIDIDEPIMSVTMGVGPGRANNIDDVTLVQFMLNIWLQDRSNAVTRQRAGKAGRALTVDGIIGPKTKSQILLFQKAMVKAGNPTQCDGCVDRLPEPAFNMYAGGIYTLWMLHVTVQRLRGKAVHELGYELPGTLFRAAARAGFGPAWAAF
jgi:hypothetical protein